MTEDLRDAALDANLRAFLVSYAEEGAGLALPDQVIAERVAARLAARRQKPTRRLVLVLVTIFLLTALAAGAIYVATQLIGDAYVPNEDLVRVALPGAPVSLAAVYGSIWVAPFDAANPELVELDPPTGDIRRTVPIPGHVCGQIQAGFGQLWIPHCPDVAMVSIVDPTTLQVRRLSGVRAHSVAFGDGSVWLPTGDGRLERVDPATLDAQATVDVEPGTVDVAVGFDSVWAASPQGAVLRIDPATLAVIARIDVGAQGGDNRSIVTADEGVWLLNEQELSIYRIDPATNVATRLDLRLQPILEDLYPTEHGLVAGAGSVWVRQDDTTIVRIDPETLEAIARFVAPKGGGAFAVSPGALWASGPADAEVWGSRLP